MKSILGLFSKIAKGNQGEALVLESITKLLKTTSNNEENFFINVAGFLSGGLYFTKSPTCNSN